MSDTSDDMEAGAALYESYLESPERQERLGMANNRKGAPVIGSLADEIGGKYLMKKSKNIERRFVFWRRAPEELTNQKGWERSGIPVVDTLDVKIQEAKNIVEEGKYETVIVLEIVKVIRREKHPVVCKHFESFK